MSNKVFRLCAFAVFTIGFGAVLGCRGKEGKEAAKPAAESPAPSPTLLTGAVPLFSSDLASGRSWTASSQIEIWPASGKIVDGPGNQVLFHTREEDSPWFMVDLAAPTSIASVDVLNRQDCCGERAVPLVVELSNDARTWREAARRDQTFREWRASFPAQDARYVRLRAARKTYLHLERIGIHGPGGDGGGAAPPKPRG